MFQIEIQLAWFLSSLDTMNKRKLTDYFSPSPPSKKQNIIGILTQRDININVKVEKPVEQKPILDIKLEKNEYEASPVVKVEQDYQEENAEKLYSLKKRQHLGPNIKAEKNQKDVNKTVSPKKKAPSTPVSRVLKSLGRDAAEAGDSVKPLLSGSFKKNCQEVAAFALFLKERQDILVARTREPSLAPPFTDNKVGSFLLLLSNCSLYDCFLIPDAVSILLHQHKQRG